MSEASQVTSLSTSPVFLSNESRGSSVSTQLREEYEDLLRYAVVTPIIHAKVPTLLKPQRSGEESLAGGGAGTNSSTSQREQNSRHPLSPQEVEVKVVGDCETRGKNLETLPTCVGTEPFTTTPTQHRPDAMMTSAGHTSSFSTAHDDVITPTMSHDLSTSLGMRSCDRVGVRMDQGCKNEPVQQTVNPEVSRLGKQIDMTCLELKRNLLAEFEQSRLRLIESLQAQQCQERERQKYEMGRMKEELERYKDLALTYEKSIGQKDGIMSNLTEALQKQKEKVDLQRSFGSWKLRLSDERRESFCSMLAQRHHCNKVKGRVLSAWLGTLRGKWKIKMEKACQSRAEQVCLELSGQYEDQLAAVRSCLAETRKDFGHMKQERDLFEENMKKAFMRGVCALNMETMSMFQRTLTSDDTAAASQPPGPPPPTININSNLPPATAAAIPAMHSHCCHPHSYAPTKSDSSGMATNLPHQKGPLTEPRFNLSKDTRGGASGGEQYRNVDWNVAGTLVSMGTGAMGSRGFRKASGAGRVQRDMVREDPGLSVLVEKHAN